MSADNGYYVTNHPDGGYAAVYYMGDEIMATILHTKYNTVGEAIGAAIRSDMEDSTEYGVRVNPQLKGLV